MVGRVVRRRVAVVGCLYGLAGLGAALFGMLLLGGMLLAEPWTALVLVALIMVTRRGCRRRRGAS
jgi:hypothetical protein